MLRIVLSVLFVVVAVSSQHCPPGVPVAQCYVDPCLDAVCPAFPTAVCKQNFCGGCFAHFYIDDDVRVDCDPYKPRIENVHFRTQGDHGRIEADNMKMTVHHEED